MPVCIAPRTTLLMLTSPTIRLLKNIPSVYTEPFWRSRSRATHRLSNASRSVAGSARNSERRGSQTVSHSTFRNRTSLQTSKSCATSGRSKMRRPYSRGGATGEPAGCKNLFGEEFERWLKIFSFAIQRLNRQQNVLANDKLRNLQSAHYGNQHAAAPDDDASSKSDGYARSERPARVGDLDETHDSRNGQHRDSPASSCQRARATSMDNPPAMVCRAPGCTSIANQEVLIRQGNIH